MSQIGPRFTPDELRLRLGLRYELSPQQQAVISDPPDEPLLVVAGAGSGKTELMALRVMWLIVNQHVRPDQVLGLTFTRKAAGELSHRIRLYLGRAMRLLGADAQLTGEPTVATYHSFAARIVREHGLRAGYEPSTRLLTEASCWQLADAVVRQHDSPAMRDFPLGPDSATAAVRALAAELSEHLREPADIGRFTDELVADVTARSVPRMYKDVRDVLERQAGRMALLPLVREYAERKRAADGMDFGDQLRRAALVARDHPDVSSVERDRFRVVLLDEYQDTSHAQVELLRSLFGGGHPVTAVGDPCQSIYGWRGASVGTLDRFPTTFTHVDGAPATVRSLSVSWRNMPEILTVANRVAEPLRQRGLRVAELAPAPGTTVAADGRVRCALLESYLDEAEWIADQVSEAWRDWPGPGARPTTAVLVRVRKQIPAIEAALRARRLPVEVVGLGGLLDTPEVRDVVCTLHALADPTAGAPLLRLLTGVRWRLGPRDVVALNRRARSLARARLTAASTPESPGAGGPVTPEPDIATDRLDDATLAEALDDLGSPQGYSPAGYPRLVAFRDELRALRRRLDQSLPDLVADVAQTIGLDVEVAVRGANGNGNGNGNSNSTDSTDDSTDNSNGTGHSTATGHSGGNGGGTGLARAHLDAIGDVAARFAAESEGATLSAFLAFLAAAEREERGLPAGEVEVVDGAVQILTAHAAKGLEWDVVAVAGLTAEVFPGRPTASDHWLAGMGVLPFPLRGDHSGLPAFALVGAQDGKQVDEARERFEEEWREHHEREERRLVYVAVTRPRLRLLCSGYWWGEGVKSARGPSVFLDEVAAACGAGAGLVHVWTPVPEDGAENPTLEFVDQAEWPLDPLGARRAAMAEAAALVRQAAARVHATVPVQDVAVPVPDAGLPVQDAAVPVPAAGAEPTPPEQAEARRWAQETTLLLAERERERAVGVVDVALPAHLSVSQLVALRRDPQRLARRLRRPLPEAPDPHARRGTAFHLWLERRFGGGELLDLDELPGYGDIGAAPDSELEALQAAFLESEWADRTPHRVEVPFATVIAGVVVRGRMDAVFTVPDAPDRYDVIDWKTGVKPTGVEATAAAVQLAAYRLAWAELCGVPVERVSAGFHYVRGGATVRPADLLDAAGLVALVTDVPESGAD